MDISLPISDSSAAGMFSGGASARSADSDRFSQTLSKQMADRPEQEPAAHSDSAQQTKAQQHATAADKRAEQKAQDADARAAHDAKNTPETAKSHKKTAAHDTADAASGDGAGGANAQPPADEKAALSSLKLAGNVEHQAADAAKADTASQAALDKAGAVTGSVLGNGSTNAALRGSAAHNEMFRNLRGSSAEGLAADGSSATQSLVSGNRLQSSGKNLPAGKADKLDKAGEQPNSFLPAGAQDWKYTADALITAVSDKAAKFDALNTQFNSQPGDALSLVDTGTGKTLSAPSAFRNELAAQNTSYASLTSDFPAGSEEWCQDFGTKIEWMSKDGVTKAELSLHPADLGALDITINTDDDRISINIVTHNEKSRDMLESSMPRLNELLKSQGLALENSNIFHHSSSDGRQPQPQHGASTFGHASEEPQSGEPGILRAALIRHRGQIDHYV